MWGFHLGRRDPKPALIGHDSKLDARSLSKTPPSVLPSTFSFHAARYLTSARCLHPSPGTPNNLNPRLF